MRLSVIEQDCFTADLLSAICKFPDCRLWEIPGSPLIPVIFSLFQHIELIFFDSVVLCCASIFDGVYKEPEQKAKYFNTNSSVKSI